MGYIGYPFPELFLGIRLTSEQQKQKTCPNIIAVSGIRYIEDAKEFNKNLEVVVAPCFRGSYHPTKKISHDKYTILVLLPYCREEAKQMLDIISFYCKNRKDVNIHIKMHPAHLEDTIKDYSVNIDNSIVKYVSGKLDDCAANADIVFSGRSSATMEIICGGLPLIYFCMPGIIKDTRIARGIDKNLYSIVYDISGFTNAIDKFRNCSKVNYNIYPPDYFIEPTMENTALLFD